IGVPFDPAAYAGNTVPHSGGTDDSGYSSEERKLMFETRKILDLPELAIGVQCCRVAVAVGHYENAWITLQRALHPDDVARLLGAATFVSYLPGAAGDGLSALACVHDRDRVLVGRLRRDPRDATRRTVCLTVVGDNLRVGAATNGVRIGSRWFPSSDRELQA